MIHSKVIKYAMPVWHGMPYRVLGYIHYTDARATPDDDDADYVNDDNAELSTCLPIRLHYAFMFVRSFIFFSRLNS